MVAKMKFQGEGLKKMEEAMDALGSRRGKAAAVHALNDVGKVAKNQTTRALAKQIGAPAKVIEKRGTITTRPASTSTLAYEINSQGGHMLLKDFKPVQGPKGVRASPWGQRRLFPGTFQVASLNGNVFSNTRGWSESAGRFNALGSKYGPAVPVEMVRGESEKAFQGYVGRQLPKRLTHHLNRAIRGTFD